MTAPSPPLSIPLSVSQLNRQVRQLLEASFLNVLVEGEISNCAMPASGHWYFTLKDSTAQIRCAMFRNRNLFVRFRPRDGQQVVVRARLSLYEARGDYQLLVEGMEEQGDGALRRQFEALKQKLQAEGLFTQAQKKNLPSLPRHIGLISSATGAAARDVLSVLGRRFPAIPVTLLPVSVQGEQASREIIQAIELANARQGCLADLDLLILARGGGSLEDLHCFNDEALARVIHHSKLPIISAVGHETDFTIADLVADMRAATPSATAELASPDQVHYLQIFQRHASQLQQAIRARLLSQRQSLQWLSERLKHPGRRLQAHAQRLDELEARMQRAVRQGLNRRMGRMETLQAQLWQRAPSHRLQQQQQRCQHLQQRLIRSMRQCLRESQQSLQGRSQRLQDISPLATLARGYSISLDSEGKVVQDAGQVAVGEQLETRLKNGRLLSRIIAVDQPHLHDEC